MLLSTSGTRLVVEGVLARNRASKAFFADRADSLARTCALMADRFLKGGRLLAFGSGHAITDAQHVSVEFVHPVIVGKRALPALDVSALYRSLMPALVTGDDIVIGFAPPEGDADVVRALGQARARGALTLALPGADADADFVMPPADQDPFVHQEIVEILYHTLWETVHVFFERRPGGHDVGATAFLYPFLGSTQQNTDDLLQEVAGSIVSKAEETGRLRDRLAAERGGVLTAAAARIAERLACGGRLLLFGNGGSATDANDWALDATASPKGHPPFHAISLSMEPAILSAIANDVGPDAMFLRQLIAHARPDDVAVGISTSGSTNVALALEEARKRGLLTVALLGHEGGEVVRRDAAEFPVVVRSDSVPRIQEVHASIYHIVLDLLAAGS